MQRVLDYHNKKYKTHVEIKGRATDVYPRLKGQFNWDWDWVCCDTETSDEIAVEVKKLTDEKLEVRYNTLVDILEGIKNDLSGKLPGTFLLGHSISPKNYYLPLQGHRGHQNKQKFKNVLCEAIFQTAQTLKLKEVQALTPQIKGQLPFALPDSFFCALQKVSDEGSALYKSSGVLGFWSLKLKEPELEKFEELVSHANDKQLKVARKEFNVKETFLVIIAEGQRLTIPETVAKALKKINHDSYSQINHIYYISYDISGEGKEVEEIPLPTN